MLSRTHKFASISQKLATTGVLPSAGYDGQIKGYPPTELASIRRAVAACAGQPTQGQCLTCKLALEPGEYDPAVSLRLKLFNAWFDWWMRNPAMRSRARATWTKTVQPLLALEPKARWAKVTGPMGAVAVTLAELSWQPTGPVQWTDAQGIEWALTDEALDSGLKDFHDFFRELVKIIKTQLWHGAAKHYGRELKAVWTLLP